MTKVNFYLLKQNSAQARQTLACRLADQQARAGQRVFIVVDSQDAARELDQLLWSFTPDSFVPHVLASDDLAAKAPVVIGHSLPVPASTTCVLNLGETAIAPQSGLSAIAEFILNDEQAKAESRVRWNHYKQLGCELQLHQL
jgi:DNA polymerase-3 subunit chi